MRILILGAGGMLGNAMIRVLSEKLDWKVYGTIRSENTKHFFSTDIAGRLLSSVDVEQHDSIVQAFTKSQPDVVINCVGLIKQLADADNPLQAIPINSLLPHRLAKLCELSGARLVHMSTDCVFSGSKGMYVETDISDAYDLYGRSKLLGEVDYPNAITLRTSIIGHELAGSRSLVGWFLAQQGSAKGFNRAIFSGLPTVEIARIIRDYVIPQPDLHGLYHVSAEPINKYELLCLVAQVYEKDIEIIPDDRLMIDRSLNSDRFKLATSYKPPVWPALIKQMYEFNRENFH